MAAEGTLGYDIDPKLRDLMGGITLYENIRFTDGDPVVRS